MPDDAEPGSTLCIPIDGQELELVLPPGAKAGDVIELEIGDKAAEMVMKIGEPETIELAKGVSLSLASELEIAADGADGTAGFIWGAGKRLAELIASQKALVEGKRVLELGSGSGVVGIAAATMGAEAVCLTDHHSALPLLQHNIALNKMGGGETSGNKLKAEALNWGDTAAGGPFDLVLGSDLLYNSDIGSDTYEKLVSSIEASLCHEKGSVLLGVRWRKPALERQFFRLMARSYMIELVSGGSLGWEQFGDEECAASVEYFKQEVEVAGRRTPLQEAMQEDKQESMSDAEIFVFDRLLTQVYRFLPKAAKRPGDPLEKPGKRAK